MTNQEIVDAIDQKVARLQEVRSLLSSVDQIPVTPAKNGRPKGVASEVSVPIKTRGTMSEEGRARIVAAQKKRWAAKKRADKKAAKEAVQTWNKQTE